jgi:hypothetical protein
MPPPETTGPKGPRPLNPDRAAASPGVGPPSDGAAFEPHSMLCNGPAKSAESGKSAPFQRFLCGGAESRRTCVKFIYRRLSMR